MAKEALGSARELGENIAACVKDAAKEPGDNVSIKTKLIHAMCQV